MKESSFEIRWKASGSIISKEDACTPVIGRMTRCMASVCVDIISYLHEDLIKRHVIFITSTSSSIYSINQSYDSDLPFEAL